MNATRIVLAVTTFCVSLCFAPMTRAQLTPQEKIKKAFSLVGHWDITRMDVSEFFESTNPSNVHGAAVGEVKIDLGSSLAEGSFDVDKSGAITGKGVALYHLFVAGGSAAAGVGTEGHTGLGIAVPVGASATLDGTVEDGKRAFTVSGQADIEKRTISLNAFQPSAGGLKIIIQPTSARSTVALWPPMTNVDTVVVVEGASLLLRAAGVVGGLKVSIEAVKYVDLAPLFATLLAGLGQPDPQDSMGPEGDAGTRGPVGRGGPAGQPGAPGTPGSKGNNGNSGTNGSAASSNGLSSALAGTVSVPIGGTAPVHFSAAFRGASYAVSLTAASGQSFSGTVEYSDKTAAGFTVHASLSSGGSTGTLKVDWIATPYQ